MSNESKSDEDLEQPLSGGNLKLVDEGISGYRHYLNEKEVHAGSRLEVMLASGDWMKARYEWSFSLDSLPYLVLNTEKGKTMSITDNTVLRWPEND